MEKSKGILALLLAVLMLALAACGTSASSEPAAGGESAAAGEASSESAAPAADGEKVTVNMINTKDDITEGLAALEAAFEAKNPNIDILVETLGSDSDTVIQARDAAGDLPDIMPVFNMGPEAQAAWVNSGKIQDISGLKAFQALPDDIKGMVTTEDGEAYCVLLSTTAYPIIYNKALFKQAGITEVPRTLDAMKEACDKLQAAGITPFLSGAKDGWTVSNQVWRAGLDAFFPAEWLDKKYAGEASFKDYGYGIFDFLDLYIANTQDKPLDTDYMTQLTLFAEGEGAMIAQGPWAYNNVIDMAPEMADAYGAFPIPFHNEEENNPMFVMQEMAYMVSADANMDAVDAWFSFIVEDPEGREIFGKQLNVMNPYGIENTMDPILSDIDTYVSAGNYVFDTIDNNRAEEFFMIDWTNIQEYMGGTLTQDQMLENMDKAWDDIVAKTA